MGALYDLRDNSNIQRGDNILFYFAGRGSRYHALPLGIEALCPADRGCPTAGSHIMVYDISDRELSSLLQEIRVAKGDCITVITDSCHTAGGEYVDGLQSVRSAPPLPYVTSESLLGISHPRKHSAESFSSPTWDWDPSCCVLLSAAFPSEAAKEVLYGDQYQGCFTRTFLALLRHKNYSSYYTLCLDMQKYMPRSRTSAHPSAVGDRRHWKPWFVSDNAQM